MPTYVYKSLTTGDTFEIQQSIADPALTEHPETGEPVKRVVQPVGIAFKGSGFYVNDSKSSSKSGAGESKTAAASKTPAASSSASGD